MKTKLLLFILGTLLSNSQFFCNAFASSATKIQSFEGRSSADETKSSFSTINHNDITMEKWYKENGILYPNLQLETGAKSIGGRGLFWKNKNRSASKGDLLAFIPQELIFEPHNVHLSASKFDSELKLLEGRDLSWATILTLDAYRALTDENDSIWKKWIELWQGGGPDGPKAFENYSTEEIAFIQNEMIDGNDGKEVFIDVVQEVIDKRYNTYQRDLNLGKEYKCVDNEELFSSLYSIILSRTANLGSQWDNKSGVIPLHDMMNHPPKDGSRHKNVELFCVGDVRDMIGDEQFTVLFSELYYSSQNENNHCGYQRPSPMYSDKDVLLVASEKISFDDELLLSYRNCDEKVELKHQIWLFLQYGFPFW